MPSVLVVDDEPSILNIFQIILSKQGYTVLTADSGRQAQLLLAVANPDIVILDVNLPDVQGGVICERIKYMTPSMPVVMCSAGAQVRDDEYIRRIGADAVLLKPFKSSDLMGLMDRFFNVEA
ncbi:MAG: response regulator [Anaerolineaceae bacterium]|nr:response regulator [Anaerolineaceae bacterium]